MMRIMLAFLFTLLALPALAQIDPRSPATNALPSVDVKRTSSSNTSDRVSGSVLVGEHAPDFGLPLAGGGQYRLKEARGRWAALFFADRREDLERLGSIADTLESLRIATIAVLDEKVQSLAAWRASTKTSLVAVADETNEITMMYGLWDHELGATRPGLFVLDPLGVVKLELLGQKVSPMSIRPLVQTAIEGL
jgi:peroxiredoxin